MAESNFNPNEILRSIGVEGPDAGGGSIEDPQAASERRGRVKGGRIMVRGSKKSGFIIGFFSKLTLLVSVAVIVGLGVILWWSGSIFWGKIADGEGDTEQAAAMAGPGVICEPSGNEEPGLVSFMPGILTGEAVLPTDEQVIRQQGGEVHLGEQGRRDVFFTPEGRLTVQYQGEGTKNVQAVAVRFPQAVHLCQGLDQVGLLSGGTVRVSPDSNGRVVLLEQRGNAWPEGVELLSSGGVEAVEVMQLNWES